MAQARKQTTESLVCPYNSLLIFDATSLLARVYLADGYFQNVKPAN